MGLRGYFRAKSHRRQVNRNSHASDPGNIHLSNRKLFRLCPELALNPIRPDHLLRLIFGSTLEQVVHIKDQLRNGDSRAAVVVSVVPLRVASYCADLDGICLLAFPDWVAEVYSLEIGSRLLTVLNVWRSTRVVADLTPGVHTDGTTTNVKPLIADFLTEDSNQIEFRKSKIPKNEWTWTTSLAREYIDRFGYIARNGSPTQCHIPAAV